MCEEIATIRRKLQKIDKGRVLFLDETAVRISEAPTHTLVAPRQQPFVITEETSSYAARFDMIACCTGKETLVSKIYTPKERGSEGARGVNQDMLLKFIDDILAQAVEGLNRYPLILVLDRSTIHTPHKILQAFHDRSSFSITEVLLMPTASAKRLSPLDNALFHDWKEAIRKQCPLTKKKIEQVMADEWNNITSTQLHAHYKHCALFDNQDEYVDCPDPDAHAHTTSRGNMTQ